MAVALSGNTWVIKLLLDTFITRLDSRTIIGCAHTCSQFAEIARAVLRIRYQFEYIPVGLSDSEDERSRTYRRRYRIITIG